MLAFVFILYGLLVYCIGFIGISESKGLLLPLALAAFSKKNGHKKSPNH